MAPWWSGRNSSCSELGFGLAWGGSQKRDLSAKGLGKLRPGDHVKKQAEISCLGGKWKWVGQAARSKESDKNG